MARFRNISAWKEHKINYWGIPKSANTSVKIALAGTSKKEFIEKRYRDTLSFYRYMIEMKSTDKWVHDEMVCEYINKEVATQNGFRNITVIRNPIERFKSQFKYNVKLRLTETKTMDDFLSHLEQTPEHMRNLHFNSQSYFIADEQMKVIPELVFKAEDMQELEEFLGVRIPITNAISLEIGLSKEHLSRIGNLFCADFNIYETHQR